MVIAIFITLSLIKSSDMLQEYEYGQLYVSGAQGLAITVMNAVYNIVARWFTDLENHRFDGNYEASLMMKTFCFQFVNSYLSLFWLAFYERDRSKLAVQLIMLVLIKSASDYFLFLVKPLTINALDKWRKGIRYVSREKRRRAEVARKLVKDDCRNRLDMFYTSHSPAKAAKIDRLMQEYEGREGVLIKHIGEARSPVVGTAVRESTVQLALNSKPRAGPSWAGHRARRRRSSRIIPVSRFSVSDGNEWLAEDCARNTRLRMGRA